MSAANETVRVESLDGGGIWRVELATPRANILDMEKIEVLTGIFERARTEQGLKAVVIGAQGQHFSFGSSVEEHMPGSFETLIPAFHGLFRCMLDASVVTLAAVRGQCLGGGLELAGFCNRLFAAPNAWLGQPEITLGVFAPAASVFLPERIGRGAAEDLCLSGRSLTADEALRVGLVDQIDDDPDEASLAYAREYLLPRSASSLRFAVRAIREGYAGRVRSGLDRVERLYVDELMSTDDARGGLEAFLEKRAASWSNS